jgi:hypothetical protein
MVDLAPTTVGSVMNVLLKLLTFVALLALGILSLEYSFLFIFFAISLALYLPSSLNPFHNGVYVSP